MTDTFLRNQIRALSLHSWLNTPADEKALAEAKAKLAASRKKVRKAA